MYIAQAMAWYFSCSPKLARLGGKPGSWQLFTSHCGTEVT